MIRIGAPGYDRTRPYAPQFEGARAGFAGVVDQAKEVGTKVLYELHVGTVAVSCSRVIELLRGFDPNHIGVIYDVPNMIRGSIEEPKMGTELLGPYLAHCHMGNVLPVADTEELRGETDRIEYTWSFTDLRRGLADVPQIIDDLRAVGFEGAVSLEDFGPGTDEEKVRTQGAYLKHLLNK